MRKFEKDVVQYIRDRSSNGLRFHSNAAPLYRYSNIIFPVFTSKSMHMSSGAMFIDNGCQCRETVFVGRTTLRLLERDRKKVGDKASRRQNERTFGSADEYVLCVSDAIVPCHDVCFIDPN